MKPDLNNLLLHPKTETAFRVFIKKPGHALLITGDAGSGKSTLAAAIAGKILDISPSAVESYPYFIQLKKSDTEKEIPVEAVRRLIKDLHLRTTGNGEIRRVVLISDAGSMSSEAQNSILKILEEPSLDTVFILTAQSTNNVLPTIASRSQVISIHPVSLGEALDYYSTDKQRDAVERAWRLSGGNMGLLSALLNDSEPHPLKNAVDMAKALIGQSPYERLIALDGQGRDKSQLLLLLDALSRVITSLHHNAVINGNKTQQRRLLGCRRLINQLRAELDLNANPKLTVMHLAMNLSV